MSIVLPRGPLSRRTVLRGAVRGVPVALALPTLEAMLPRDAHADTTGLGPIFGLFFWANGVPWHAAHGPTQGGHPDTWTPTGTGAGFSPAVLQEPLGDHPYSVLTGLEPHTDVPSSPAGQSDGHMRGFMVGLTSDRPRPEGFDHPSHTLTALRPTLDQFVADREEFYADYPPRYRSLELGVSTARFHDYGHWNAISYNGPDSLNPPISDPGRLYDLLFGVPSGDADLGRRTALLDAVLDDAADLRGRLGAADQHRLDDHMEHLYEVRRRLDLGDIACAAPGVPSSSSDLYTQTGTMAEMLALGLACNVTRVFSFMLTSPATTHIFRELGVASDMHTVCHAGYWDQVFDITHLQMQCLRLLLDALGGTLDPTGASLLDRAALLATSEYGEGWKHSVKELPVLLCGRADGRLVPGHHVRDAGGNVSRAHLTLLQALGLNIAQYGFNGGETTDPFTELLA